MRKDHKRSLIIVAFCLYCLLTGCGEEKKADILAQYAQEQFDLNDKDVYVSNLREQTGISDIDIDLNLKYYPEHSYEKDEKALYVDGIITFESDEIDKYYKRDGKSADQEELAEIMNKIKEVYSKECNYTYFGKNGTAHLRLCDNNWDGFTVKTSEGHRYEFNYATNHDTIEYDGDIIYIEKKRAEDYDNSSSIPNTYSGEYDAKLRYSGTDNVLICASEDVMDRFMTAVNNDNQGTLEELFASGQCRYTEQGTKCNIIDEKLTRCKVKLLDGSYAGNTVWVVIEAVQKE